MGHARLFQVGSSVYSTQDDFAAAWSIRSSAGSVPWVLPEGLRPVQVSGLRADRIAAAGTLPSGEHAVGVTEGTSAWRVLAPSFASKSTAVASDGSRIAVIQGPPHGGVMVCDLP